MHDTVTDPFFYHLANTIGADFFLFFFLWQRTNFLPPLTLEVGPLNIEEVWGSAVSPSGVWGKAPADTIWCILESKSAALEAAVLLILLRTNVIFCTKTSLTSYGGSKSS